MAQIKATNADKVFKINRFLGVNENPDGDTNLRMGEASTMTNFKITNDGSLQKRPGTQNVANLLFNYDIDVGDAVNVLTELNTANAEFQLYPSLDITDGGILFPTGTPVTVNAATASPYADYYWQSGAGNIYRFWKCEYTAHDDATHIDGGWVTYGGEVNASQEYGWAAALEVSNGALIHGALTSKNASDFTVGEIFYSYADRNGSGTPYKFTRWDQTAVWDGSQYWPVNRLWGQPVYFHADDTWKWWFYPVTVIPNTTDSQVRGIWSGRVGDNEVICAACNNRLWQLSIDENGEWTKSAVGFINTEKPVHFFGFDGKLYMLNGKEYLVWDGETLSTVTGYRPLIAVAAPPAGGGTLLERINMLNGLRRIWFSPDGTAKTFHLPEKSISVDYVKNLATGDDYAPTTDYTVDAANGTVTFTTAPSGGTSTVEIGYSTSTTYRANIEAMTLSELFNGANDNRIFLYGDGSNKAYYSDIDYDGQARADYFPDLNVVHIGEANTPITSMLRHHNRLLAFKEDSAYSIAYGTITLVTGALTAGFYVTTINKGIGSAGYAQAQLIENKVRTLDGRSIYEWAATDSSGNVTADQRNANPISEKVDTTIKQINLEKAITFFDKIDREYYIVENGTAIVQNTDNKAWYIYRNFPAVCMIVYKDELYFGTADGFIRHVSRDYRHDIGSPIQCYWESGSMDFGASFKRKYSDSVWIVLKPEDFASVNVTVVTDKLTNYEDVTVIADYTAEVATGFFSYLNLNYEHFSYNINGNPQTQRRKIKVKNFTWYKLIFSTADNDTTATVLRAEIKARETGVAK
jgi:hypothetical protein